MQKLSIFITGRCVNKQKVKPPVGVRPSLNSSPAKIVQNKYLNGLDFYRTMMSVEFVLKVKKRHTDNMHDDIVRCQLPVINSDPLSLRMTFWRLRNRAQDEPLLLYQHSYFTNDTYYFSKGKAEKKLHYRDVL